MTTVTLAQVAERAGVSTATVSMVLRNRGRISQATRERVLKALDETGYVYNQTAANLRNRSSNPRLGCCCMTSPTRFTVR